MMNLISKYSLKQIIGTIIFCAGLTFGVANAEDASPVEDPGLWDKTKKNSGEAWDATK
ncbi:MAG: hypothetical protein GQ537_06085, partial [Gammaproteobacteria bacterium]|nr:hypothetical protein [Gammaproteobacteria bacterium]